MVSGYMGDGVLFCCSSGLAEHLESNMRYKHLGKLSENAAAPGLLKAC